MEVCCSKCGVQVALVTTAESAADVAERSVQAQSLMPWLAYGAQAAPVPALAASRGQPGDQQSAAAPEPHSALHSAGLFSRPQPATHRPIVPAHRALSCTENQAYLIEQL